MKSKCSFYFTLYCWILTRKRRMQQFLLLDLEPLDRQLKTRLPVTLPQASLKKRMFMSGVDELQTRIPSLLVSKALSRPVVCLLNFAASKA